jgi:phosphonate transport system substrate-binding protein
MEPAVRDQLRVLWTAPPLPSFLFAAHPRVPEGVTRRVAEAMIRMGQDPEGRELLKAVNFKGIVPARDADYDVVRRMQLHMPD